MLRTLLLSSGFSRSGTEATASTLLSSPRPTIGPGTAPVLSDNILTIERRTSIWMHHTDALALRNLRHRASQKSTLIWADAVVLLAISSSEDHLSFSHQEFGEQNCLSLEHARTGHRPAAGGASRSDQGRYGRTGHHIRDELVGSQIPDLDGQRIVFAHAERRCIGHQCETARIGIANSHPARKRGVEAGNQRVAPCGVYVVQCQFRGSA